MEVCACWSSAWCVKYCLFFNSDFYTLLVSFKRLFNTKKYSDTALKPYLLYTLRLRVKRTGRTALPVGVVGTAPRGRQRASRLARRALHQPRTSQWTGFVARLMNLGSDKGYPVCPGARVRWCVGCAPEGRVLRVGRKGSQERAAALCHAPPVKAQLIKLVDCGDARAPSRGHLPRTLRIPSFFKKPFVLRSVAGRPKTSRC